MLLSGIKENATILEAMIYIDIQYYYCCLCVVCVSSPPPPAPYESGPLGDSIYF
jgi:hypothetical protein